MGASLRAGNSDFGGAVVQAVGGARRFDVPLDKGPLQRQLIRTDLQRVDRRRDDRIGHQHQRAGDRQLAASGQHQRRRQQRRHGLRGLQRQPDVLLDVIDAGHQLAMIGVQQLVAAQPEIRGQPDQEKRQQHLEYSGFEAPQAAQVVPVELPGSP